MVQTLVRQGFWMTFRKRMLLPPREEIGLTVENVEVQKENARFVDRTAPWVCVSDAASARGV